MLLSRANLEAAKVASKDETRATLRSLSIEETGRTVATDGHRLLTVSPVPGQGPDGANELDTYPVKRFGDDAAPTGGAVLIPAADALKIGKAIPRIGNRQLLPILGNAIRLPDRNGSAVFGTTDLDRESVIMAHREDAKHFPKWRQVMPKAEPKVRVCVNARYLRELAAFVERHATDRDRCHMVLEIHGPTSPIRFTAALKGGQEAEGLLMPIRLPKE